MGTIPAWPDFTAGELVTAAKLDEIKAAGDFWALPPQCFAYRSGALTISTSNVWQIVPFDAEIFDIVQSGDSPMHDNSTNSARIYIRTSGKYEISGACEFFANATGARTAKINLNSGGSESGGTMLVTQTQGSAGAGIITSVSVPTVTVPLDAGDYVEMFVRQISGGSLGVTPGRAQTWMQVKLSAA